MWYRPVDKEKTMELIKVKNPAEGAQKAFDIYQAALASGVKVLGLATGSTPIALYEKLTESTLDFSNVTSINLDEYLGLSGDNEQSYHYFMNQYLFNKKPFKKSYLPNGISDNHDAAAVQYDKIISENPIDLQLLGIGRNGHIGFNEPGTSFESTTHIVDLTQSTIDANARFFDKSSDVPTQAISMGIASVMSAKKILLMAYGIDKADVIAATVNGPVTEKVPASVLQNHDNVTIIIDEAAATKL